MEVHDERKPDVFEKIKGSALLKKIKGIKNIRLIAAIFIIAVALLIYSSVATNNAVRDASGTESAYGMDQEESRLASVLEGLEGVGRVETMITRGGDDEIVGVIVIAEGAEDIGVRLRLLSAVTTAMGVDKQIVNVYTMK
ncbi:MAG TPA: hypothetical protein IAC16_03760 [Candidatus Limadaptatus stercoravium]|nr:hypothetical protein [Candidatus Limadaptatus stercoravium]